MPEFERLRANFGWNVETYATQKEGVWMTGRRAAVNFPDESYDACAAVEDSSFWFRHRNWILTQMLKTHQPGALWEIGSGNGFVARHLQNNGIEVVTVEPGLAGARTAAKRGVTHSICGFIEDLKLPELSIPAIGCFDVLEHLEHPEIMLCEFFRVLAPGGVISISLPAMTSLWSEMDDVSGHFRRYSTESANEMMTAAGFIRRQSEYMMISMVLPMYFLRARPYKMGRKMGKAKTIAAGAAQLATQRRLSSCLVDTALWIERKLSRVVSLPCGTSVAGVWTKPK